MASLSLSIFFVFLLSLNTLNSKARVTEEEIKVICLQTNDPPFCFRSLKSDPRLDMSNVQTLAKTITTIAHNYAKKTCKEIGWIIEIASDPSVRKKYQLCAENYKEAMAELVGAEQYLASGYYQKLRLEAVRAKVKAKTREDNVEKTFKTITPIRDNNRDFENLCSILFGLSLIA